MKQIFLSMLIVVGQVSFAGESDSKVSKDGKALWKQMDGLNSGGKEVALPLPAQKLLQIDESVEADLNLFRLSSGTELTQRLMEAVSVLSLLENVSEEQILSELLND